MALKNASNVAVRKDVLTKVRELATQRRCTSRFCIDQILREAVGLPQEKQPAKIKKRQNLLTCPICSPSSAHFTPETLKTHMETFHRNVKGEVPATKASTEDVIEAQYEPDGMVEAIYEPD